VNYSRRHFLTSALGALGVAGVGGSMSRLALASVAADRYYVFAYFGGGWDVLMSLDPLADDPRSDDALLDAGIVRSLSRADEIDDSDLFTDTGLRFGPAPFANGTVTTCMQPLLTTFATGGASTLSDVGMSIVRGMTMDTLTHQVGRRRFLTGQPPSGQSARGSSIATVLAAMAARGEPVPNLTSGVESYNVDQAQWATALSADNVDDLLKALRPGELSIAPEERDRVQSLLAEFRDCIVAQRSPNTQKAIDARGSATGLVSSGVDGAFDLFANTPQMQTIRDRFQIANNARSSVGARAALAAQAIATQTSRVVSYRGSDGLDTHFDNWADTQFASQYAGFRSLAALVEHLAGTPHPTSGFSMMEHTTIVAFSEFSRTPLINGNGGRDHWIMNSALVLGKGIQTGIIGQSGPEGMAPTTVPINGVDTYVKPEHIHQALLHDIGLPPDTVDLRVDPLTQLLTNP
jgi:hypothetical protein